MLLDFNPTNGMITGGADLPVAFVARSAWEKDPAIGSLLAAAPELRDCVEAMLLFWSAERWTTEMNARWHSLTGNTDCTSKALCDFGRSLLACIKPAVPS